MLPIDKTFESHFDTPVDVLEVSVIFLVFCALVTGPVWIVLKPSPRSYVKFISTNWAAREKTTQILWMPHYFGAVTINAFLDQAVHTSLHYPLLQTHLGASVFQVGVIDAASQTCGAVLDSVLRHSIGRGLWRSDIFLLDGVFKFCAHTIVIGCVVRIAQRTSGDVCAAWLCLSGPTWGLLAVVAAQSISFLNLSLAEFGVMRCDVAEVMLEDQIGSANVPSHARREKLESISMKMGQLFTVCKYPATIAAAVMFDGSSLGMGERIYSTYAVVGFLGLLFNAWLAFSWRGYPPPHCEAPRSTPFADLRPGLPYFNMAVRVGTYNAMFQVVRSGYIRLLNLKAFSVDSMSQQDLAGLFFITFGVSSLFFWLSDKASEHKVPQTFVSSAIKFFPKRSVDLSSNAQQKRNEGKMLTGIVAFSLMGIGHLILALSGNFYGLMLSAVAFGLGQAVSTGQRTSIKDDVRHMLRAHDHAEAYRKQFMRIISSLGTTFSILASLVVGIAGEVNLALASLLYVILSVVGILGTIAINMNVEQVFKQTEDERKNLSIRSMRKPLLDGK